MLDLVDALSGHLQTKSLILCTAESCTGGRIASAITSIAGSSAIFDRGFVTYSNAAKHECLGVAHDIFDRFGAVSIECAAAMASGALKNSAGDITISVTGIAGPDGGSADKPVGFVCFGIAQRDQEVFTYTHTFTGTRENIQNAATRCALQLLIDELS